MTSELKECRICYEDKTFDDLINPCLCDGALAFVHRKCLNEWRLQNINENNLKFCEICHFKYIIETVVNDSKVKRIQLFKYYFFFIFYFIIYFMLIQYIIFILAIILKTIDTDCGKIKNLFSTSIDGFFIYYLNAFILLLPITSIIASFIFFSQTNNHNNNNQRVLQNSTIIDLVIVIIIWILVGLILVLFSSVIILKKIMNFHVDKLSLRQEKNIYQIKDFQKRRNELVKYKKSFLYL
ncbi:hypothetical protein I4U23_017174 [Adineta vaga]|nr:hypothetical protein I4U23_017174 [Adineta vaga]